MSVYVAVVEAGGFARAARKLQMSPPAVTRAIATLEDRLGVKLLSRTTRYVRVTELGQKYYDDAKRIISLVDEADEAVLGINAEPRGQLTITASVLFGRLYVMPAIVEYLERYPAVEINALLVDRVVNMLDEGADVAIRIADLPDSTYRALRVGSVRRVLCASPDYFSNRDIPAHPEDLQHHRVILSRGLNSANEIRLKQTGRPLTVKLNPVLTVNDNESAAAAALAGLGITQLLSYQIADHIRSGKLRALLTEFESPSIPVHIVHREGRHPSPKIRSFVDFIAARLKDQLSLP